MNAGDIGGLKSEYQALCRSSRLTETYEFIPMVLERYHRGVNLQDIFFYYKAIKKTQPDIIHIRGAGVESLNAVLAAKLANQGKCLVAVHGMFSDLVYYNPLKRWICLHFVEKAIFRFADGISCVCQTAENRTYFDRYRKKMLPYVYNRIPKFGDCSEAEKTRIRQQLQLPSQAKIGIYVGRMTKEKGLSYLLEALEQMDDAWPDNFYLLLVGEGNYLAEMQDACKTLQHNKNIIFCGKQFDIEKYLHASDFFIQSSLHENLSISILEACAAKLPCLATNVGGNAEMITDQETGILVPPYSAEALKENLIRLCDREIREKLKACMTARTFEAFSNQNVDKQLDAVYRRLLQNETKE